jgi:hypothetical protein
MFKCPMLLILTAHSIYNIYIDFVVEPLPLETAIYKLASGVFMLNWPMSAFKTFVHSVNGALLRQDWRKKRRQSIYLLGIGVTAPILPLINQAGSTIRELDLRA